MVLEIKLSNFFSISDGVVLDLRAGKINTEQSRRLTENIFEHEDLEVLKSVAIYGANASGKSNIIKAIRFCVMMVFNSHNHNEGDVFNFKPFKFGSYKNKPSSFSIRFVYQAIEYHYSFTLTRNEILTEELYHYPHGRRAKVFKRDERLGKEKKEKYSFGSAVIKRPLDVAESTSKKTLFVSRGSQMDREILKKVFNYFHTMLILRHSQYSISHISELVQDYKENLLQALKMADSDIIDFKYRTIKQKGRNLIANLEKQEAEFNDTELERIELRTYHRYDPSTSFDFMTEESDGTRKLFFMMLTIIDIVKNGKSLIVDEIEDSLHPKIVEYILKMFNASARAQLIFSTHNTNLLDLSKFRKDQIWFVNKTDDGSSDLYSLYDYSDFRDTMNLEKAYLQGRFDSVPIVDDSALSLQTIISE